MHFGLVMECDYRQGTTQEEAFSEAFEQAGAAEDLGLDGVWLAERHFASPDGPLDGVGGLPSIISAPLVMAAAIAARTSRIRVGIAVNVLPLCHPIRMAEEAATVDQISGGRLDFGVGRSGFARAYEGYGISYAESRDRLMECLEVVLRAWTADSFSYKGEFYRFDDVCVLPKPHQKPHPPVRVAAATKSTFPTLGRLGYPVFVGLRAMDLPSVVDQVTEYRKAWAEAGHPGEGDVVLRMPVYVADTPEAARSEPQESTMLSYRRLARSFSRAAGAPGSVPGDKRAEAGRQLDSISYDALLEGRLTYGTPDEVTERIDRVRAQLGLSGVIVEMNVGGIVPRERILNSLRLFAERVVPQLR